MIHLRAADGQETGRKHSTVKPHTRTLVLLSVLHLKTYTHYMLAQGHIKWSLPVFLSLIMCSIHAHTCLCMCLVIPQFYAINRARIQIFVILFPWQYIYSAPYYDNVIGLWLFFSVDQMTSPTFSASLWYRSFWCHCLMVCLRAFDFSLSQWTNQKCKDTSLFLDVNSCLGGIEKRKLDRVTYYKAAVEYIN